MEYYVYFIAIIVVGFMAVIAPLITLIKSEIEDLKEDKERRNKKYFESIISQTKLR